ncbi:MAG: hypothetical protein WD023_11720 [Ilumatobacteraceae bacterium]
MKRRTLDLVFSIGGLVFSVLLLIVGLVLNNQSNFAENYVKDQFSQQQISFTPEAGLNGEQDDAPCLVTNAGQILENGKQAECYANEYIAFHLAESATGAGYEGATYATLGTPQRELRTQMQAATDAGQPTEAIQADLDKVNGLRDTMFRGETLRGLLLTTYGFSIFGERAGQAATLVFIAAALIAILSIAGLIHAFTTKKDETVLLVAHEHDTKEPALI